MSVTILRGVSGAGKSTWASKHYPVLDRPLLGPRGYKPNAAASVYSADDYFVDLAGEYKFSPQHLPEAHAHCLRSFVRDVSGNVVEHLIVDNTNTTVAEVAPYAALALAYRHDLEIVTILCDPVAAAKRNVHGVPLPSVIEVEKRLREAEFPPWWKHRIERANQHNPARCWICKLKEERE